MADYTSSFSAVAVTAAQDVFEIVAHASSAVLIHDVKLGQYTDFGDTAAEILSVIVHRGFTVAGSNGSANTPTPLRSNSRAAVSTVTTNNTTVANTGTSAVILADTWNIAAGWSLRDTLSLPNSADRIGGLRGVILQPSERLVIRITAPADSLTCNGTMVFEELGNIL